MLVQCKMELKTRLLLPTAAVPHLFVFLLAVAVVVVDLWTLPASVSANKLTGIRRIRRDDYMDRYTEVLPCLDATPPSLIPFIQGHRKTQRDPPYSSLSCAPKQCFRVIQDGFEFLLTNDPNESERRKLERLRNRLEQEFYKQGWISQATAPLEVSRERRVVTSGKSSRSFNPDQPYEQLHADYFEVADYVVTAILYDEPPKDLKGGETCFADAFANVTAAAITTSRDQEYDDLNDSTTEETRQGFILQEGLLVEPRRGRLVLLSGGGENLHGPLAIRRKDQQRVSYVFFFRCKDLHQMNKEL